MVGELSVAVGGEHHHLAPGLANHVAQHHHGIRANPMKIFEHEESGPGGCGEEFGDSEEEPLTTGAGLGLVQVRRLARSMHGNLKVDSEPGRGSAFRLTVVLDRAEQPA